MKEFLDLLLGSIPGWVLLALDVWDRLKRRRKLKKSDRMQDVD